MGSVPDVLRGADCVELLGWARETILGLSDFENMESVPDSDL
jgi:hypothetical protein